MTKSHNHHHTIINSSNRRRHIPATTMTRRLACVAVLTVAALTAAAQPHQGQVQQGQQNRAIGQYPGNPAERYAPTVTADGSGTYRNLALWRTTRQRSAWDYNLTSQLLTDGITCQGEPTLLRVSTPDGPVAANRREAAIDGNEWTCNTVLGSDTWLQYDWQGMSVDVDNVRLVCRMAYDPQQATGGYRLRVLTSPDGTLWQLAAEVHGDSLPGRASRYMAHSDPNKNTGDGNLPTRNIDQRFDLTGVAPFAHLRVQLVTPGAIHWTITELQMTRQGHRATGILPATHFTSAWVSDGTRDQWVAVDLGAPADVDVVRLHWLTSPAKGEIGVSDDGEHWRTVASLGATDVPTQEVSVKAHCRHVRVTMQGAGEEPIAMSELEVLGTGGVVALPHAQGGATADGRWLLNGGDWRLQRASQVTASGSDIASQGFATDGWLAATVPATVLSSHVNAGALPDMNYDDNLMLSSESYFNGDFWYRRAFDVPASMQGKRVTLNLDGINWKADVWLNGQQVGKVEGAFKRAAIDVTSLLHPTGNVLAVRIIANANPGGVKVKTELNTDYNGGVLGADNPTFHATIGWDWISSIRGRDIGIWDDVYLTASGDVSVSDPVVTTTLGATDTLATMTPAVMLTNHASHQVSGTLRGNIGDIHFEKPVTLMPGSTTEVTFAPDEFTQLRARQMRLWWPNGLGEPYLYDAAFAFVQDGAVSDEVHYKAGIRQVTYTDMDTRLLINVNHRRVVPLGGNWAFSENNLNYRGREFDAAVRYHKEMNYNMIRNWVGMTGDREFYEACDRYGIMVWQDFWLANPADGPDPDDEAMFMDNARDLVLKIRNHPCIAIYCGRNEGYPPKTLDAALRETVAQLHSGLGYISSSADDGVSGHGPYNALDAKEYFERQTGKMHTERGMPNVMTLEGLSRTLAPEHLWPQNLYWGRHDYTMAGAQRGASFNQLIADNFGEPTSAAQFTQWAQWINLEGYRAMYEADSRDRLGLLIWMSHPCWPSMVWQTYDYYLEPTAAYFGVKHACEPLHVQWNPLKQCVEVVNRSAGNRHLTVTATLYDLNGTALWSNSKPCDASEDATVKVMTVNLAGNHSGSRLMRLSLTADNGTTSVNDYMLPSSDGNRRDLTTMPQASVSVTASAVRADGDTRHSTVSLRNTGSVMAVMLRLNLVGSDGEQILPVIYSDNYLHLLPGESRDIDIEWNVRDSRGTTPALQLSGMNLNQQQSNL